METGFQSRHPDIDLLHLHIGPDLAKNVGFCLGLLAEYYSAPRPVGIPLQLPQQSRNSTENISCAVISCVKIVLGSALSDLSLMKVWLPGQEAEELQS